MADTQQIQPAPSSAQQTTLLALVRLLARQTAIEHSSGFSRISKESKGDEGSSGT